jgi:hypothetical protein
MNNYTSHNKNTNTRRVNYSNIGKTVARGALKTLGWVTIPQLMATIKYSQEYGEFDYNPFPEFGIFLGATAITMGATFGANKAYNQLCDKEYSIKDIKIEVKHDSKLKNDLGGIASYASPLTRLIMLECAKDITYIKTSSLIITTENTNIINFDKNNGFSINKNAYYNNDFILTKITKWGDKEAPIKYAPCEVKKISLAYDKLRQKSVKIRAKALSNGNIGSISSLKENMIKLQKDHEVKQVQLKKIQLEIDKNLTDIVNQLNTEYTNYKNEPLDTAIPVRDYNLSDMKNE